MKTKPQINTHSLHFLANVVIAATLNLAGDCVAQTQYQIPTTSNLYAAGQLSPESPAGGGAGSMPIWVQLPPGVGRELLITPVTGSVLFCPSCGFNGPDGIGFGSVCTVSSWRGISQYQSTQIRALMGVFLDGARPVDPPPPAILWNTAAISQPTISAGLRQIMFIGDGFTSSGAQRFLVPTGATRLFLGFVDGFCGQSHGTYGDVAGGVSATITYAGCLWLLTQPLSRQACQHDNVTIQVTTAGTAPQTYQWRKNSIPIDPELNPSAATSSLILPSVTAQDRATYDVVITNSCGSMTSNTAFLDVCACLDCPADFNQDGGIDGSDIQDFFTAWESGGCDGDTNQDGGIDGSDVTTFFTAWENGAC